MPNFTVALLPETKILIDVLSTLMQASPARVIDIVIGAYVQNLGPQEKAAVDTLAQAAMNRLRAAPPASAVATPVASYSFSRLCFKRDVITALAPQDSFRVTTPQGVFQMTKADFQRVFPNVEQSRSYLATGIYHYPKVPARAEQFRIG